MAPQPARVEGAPSRILIPSASIDLPVVKGSYAPASNSWSVADDAANYALNTALLNNQKGETLIYGHNTRKVFGSILNMTPGDEVYVYSENNHVFRYHFTGSQNIDPARTDIFKTMTAGPPGLKLITCDGANFEYRHLMSFTLVGSS
jgi:LPXTG-site transpeptidase (sortase) family protein